MQIEIAVLYICMIILCLVIMLLVLEQQQILKRQRLEAELLGKILDILNNIHIHARRKNSEDPKDKS